MDGVSSPDSVFEKRPQTWIEEQDLSRMNKLTAAIDAENKQLSASPVVPGNRPFDIKSANRSATDAPL